jgi:hypothetical protein
LTRTVWNTCFGTFILASDRDHLLEVKKYKINKISEEKKMVLINYCVNILSSNMFSCKINLSSLAFTAQGSVYKNFLVLNIINFCLSKKRKITKFKLNMSKQPSQSLFNLLMWKQWNSFCRYRRGKLPIFNVSFLLSRIVHLYFLIIYTFPESQINSS